MAKQVLNDNVTFGEQRSKINGNFTELYNAITAAAIKAALETLSGASRLDAAAIKNLPSVTGNVPAGGTAGQVLSKINSTDYNTQWVTPSGGGGGGGAVEADFATVLLFDADKYMVHTQTGAIAFTRATGANVLGKVISIKLTGNSADAITFSSDFKILSGAVDNTKTNYIYLNFVADNDVRVTISFVGGSVDAGIIGAPLLEGKMLVGDATNLSKAVTPSGDANIDTNGVIKFGATPTSVGNKHIPFRTSLGALVGSDALRFAPDTGFDVATDFAPVDTGSTEGNYIGNIFKSKIRSSSVSNSLTQEAWVYESDLIAKADLQHLTGFHIKNKLNRAGFAVEGRYFRVTNFEGGNVVLKFEVGIDNNNIEYTKFSGWTFKGDRLTVGGALELYTNDGFSYLKAAYFGVRFQLPVTVGSTNTGNTGAQFEIFNNDPLKPAMVFNNGVVRNYNQRNTVTANATATKVFELSIANGDGHFIEVSLLAVSGFTTSYFVFTTCVMVDNDGIISFKGPDKNIIIEENDNVTWLLTTAVDDATNKFEIFFSKATVGDITVTTHVKTIKTN